MCLEVEEGYNGRKLVVSRILGRREGRVGWWLTAVGEMGWD